MTYKNQSKSIFRLWHGQHMYMHVHKEQAKPRTFWLQKIQSPHCLGLQDFGNSVYNDSHDLTHMTHEIILCGLQVPSRGTVGKQLIWG